MTEQSGHQEFLVIAIDDSRFALRARDVESAVAPPAVTPLPWVPAYVEGLVNVNDRVLPLLDLRRLTAPGSTPVPVTELVVVETGRAPCALRVDRVVTTLQVDSADVHAIDRDNSDADAGNDSAAPALVAGRFAHDGHTVLLLDRDVLGRLVCAEEVPAGRRGLLGRLQGNSEARASAEETCIVVRCGAEVYAVALADAVEILDTAGTTPVPGAPAMVEGIAVLRGDVLLVLSLARLLGRGDTESGARSIVVIEHEGARYGLRVDQVDGIHAYDPARLRRVDADSGELAGVIIDEARVIGLLGIPRLLNDGRCRQLAPFLPAQRATTELAPELVHVLLEVAVAGEGFGIPLASVRRIARYSSSVQVDARDGGHIAGAVNIDGAILPVVDLNVLLALASTSGISDRGAWIVVGRDDQEWAIPVHEARRIVEVPASAVEDFSDNQRRMVSAVARIDNRLLSLLNMNPLLETV